MNVDVPGVGVIEFPDGTSPEAIKSALAKYRTTPEQPEEDKGLLKRITDGVVHAAGVVKDNTLGDDDPTTQNFGEKVGTAINKAGEAMTFGLIGDEVSAAVESVVPGVDYATRRDHYRDQQKVLERDNPGVALGADVGGALTGALLPLGAIGTLGKGAGLLPRVGASAAAGAGMGGTYGFMEGEGADDRLSRGQTGAAIGGAVGAAAPAIGAMVQKGADAIKSSAAIRAAAKGAPTTEQLRTAGGQAYDAIDNSGVQIKPQAFDGARQKILDALRNKTGFDELPGPGSLTPNTARVAQIMNKSSDDMAQSPTSALPFKSLDQMRRQAGAAAGNVTNKADQQAGMTVIEELDDFVNRLGPNDVVTGDVDALKTAIPKARELWSKMSKSQLLDDAMDMEGNYLSGGASAIRNRVASILRNPRLSRGFTDAEKKVLQRVVSGSIPQQLLNYMGSGLGMMGQIGAGAVLGGGMPGALGGAALAAASRKGAEAVTRKQAEIARAIVANGGMQTLPVATDSSRRLVEALMRRTGAVTPQ